MNKVESPNIIESPKEDISRENITEDFHTSVDNAIENEFEISPSSSLEAVPREMVATIYGMTDVQDDKSDALSGEESRRVSVQFKDMAGVGALIEEKPEIPSDMAELIGSVLNKHAHRRASSVSRHSGAGSRSVSRKSSADDIRSQIGKGRASLKISLRDSVSVAEKTDMVNYVEMGPRIRPMEDDDFVDFYMADNIPLMFQEVEEYEEQAITEEEEAHPRLNREPYYERYEQASKEIVERKIMHNVLQKKLAIYFKRKKMDYVSKDTDCSLDQINKYNRKLDAYGELMEFVACEKLRINADIGEKKRQREQTFKALLTMFEKMQSKEGEIGYGLINTKTGKAIPDKLVERLLHRQSIQMEQISFMRLTSIRLKQMVQEKLDAISSLDEVAPGLLLADYEQLKVMNQSYIDKIEERDEELTKLRSKCTCAIQTLAHFREKLSAMQNDLENLHYSLRDIKSEIFDVRCKLNRLKQEKDKYRQGFNQMRDASGIVAQPILLKDMKEGLNDAEILSRNLELVINEYKKKAKQIKIIRGKIEEAMEIRRIPKKCNSKSGVTVSHSEVSDASKSRVYRGRPFLMMPQWEGRSFDGLESVKPNITLDRRRHNCRYRNGK